MDWGTIISGLVVAAAAGLAWAAWTDPKLYQQMALWGVALGFASMILVLVWNYGGMTAWYEIGDIARAQARDQNAILDLPGYPWDESNDSFFVSVASIIYLIILVAISMARLSKQDGSEKVAANDTDNDN